MTLWYHSIVVMHHTVNMDKESSILSDTFYTYYVRDSTRRITISRAFGFEPKPDDFGDHYTTIILYSLFCKESRGN